MNEVLVTPATLAAELAEGRDVRLIDVRWTLGGPSGRLEYEAGHLPGAVWVDLETELSGLPGDGGRHPVPAVQDLQATMRRLGVSSTTPVVAYDAANSAGAARLWWLLTDAGHTDVRVLDGGLTAWREAGLPVEAGWHTPGGGGDFEPRPGQRAQLDVAGVQALIARGDGPRLVDVRAAERFRGDVEPIDPIAGHIPTAVNVPWAGNHRPDGRFLPAAEIAARYAGVVDAGMVLYCGSGVTAAQSLLALESAGLTAAIYPGSWSEWIRDPRRPVETGRVPAEG